jgi:hypothetical protein
MRNDRGILPISAGRGLDQVSTRHRRRPTSSSSPAASARLLLEQDRVLGRLRVVEHGRIMTAAGGSVGIDEAKRLARHC